RPALNARGLSAARTCREAERCALVAGVYASPRCRPRLSRRRSSNVLPSSGSAGSSSAPARQSISDRLPRSRQIWGKKIFLLAERGEEARTWRYRSPAGRDAVDRFQTARGAPLTAADGHGYGAVTW